MKLKPNGSCDSVRSTVFSNIDQSCKGTNNFVRRYCWEYRKATYMHWTKLPVLFEPKNMLFFSGDKKKTP